MIMIRIGYIGKVWIHSNDQQPLLAVICK